MLTPVRLDDHLAIASEKLYVYDTKYLDARLPNLNKQLRHARGAESFGVGGK